MIRHIRPLTLGVSALTLLLAWGVEAKAQDKTFVSIAAIPGDSTDTLHAGWMDAYALDASATSTSGTGGGVTTFADVALPERDRRPHRSCTPRSPRGPSIRSRSSTFAVQARHHNSVTSGSS